MIDNQVLAKEYTSGQPITKLAVKYGVSRQAISQRLHSCQTVIRPPKVRGLMRRTISVEQTKQMVEQYRQGHMSVPKLAQLHGIRYAQVLYVLRDQKVKFERGRRQCQYQHNVNAFNTLTPESSYWLGFLMCRAHSYETVGYHSRLGLDIHKGDHEHLNKLKKFLQLGTPLYLVSKSTLRLNWMVSRSEIRTLAQLGVSSVRKQRSPAPVLLNNVNFWRGVFDGGCSIRYQQKHVYLWIVPRKRDSKLLMQFAKFLQSKLDVPFAQYIGQKTYVIQVLKYLYGGCPTMSYGLLALKSYYDKAQDVIAKYGH